MTNPLSKRPRLRMDLPSKKEPSATVQAGHQSPVESSAAGTTAPPQKRPRFRVDHASKKERSAAAEASPIVGIKPSRQLFIRSLPASVTEQSLTELFSQSYPLRHAVLVCEPKTKQSRGYGFVTFADAEDAQRAREEFNGHLIDGQKIKVELAEHRHRAAEAGQAEAGQAKGAKAKEGQPSAATRNDNVSSSVDPAKPGHGRPLVDARQPSKLIVRNLPWSIREPDQLASLFRSHGKVKQAFIPKTKPGLLSGFGFVVLRGRKNAEKALAGVNGKEVDGRKVAVDWAVEKHIWNGVHAGQGAASEDETRHEGRDAEAQGVDKVDDLDRQADASDDDQASDLPAEPSDDDLESDGEHEDESSVQEPQMEDRSGTLFIRNVPFTATDDSLYEHFKQFGPVRYCRVVLDPSTERPRGTAFVSFYRPSDADGCLRGAPHPDVAVSAAPTKSKKAETNKALVKHSVLENEMADPTGRYMIDGRLLQLSPAVKPDEAARLTEAGNVYREGRDRDKRRLYLLAEGTVRPGSSLYQVLPPSELQAREASAKQRKTLIQRNPTLHLSLTRLSVRNIPRSVTSKDLKALARQAVVEFAKEVKAKQREPLSKEEIIRGGEEMRAAEKARKARGKGIVKQAKIVFEGREGTKVGEATGAGRSRGYGFVEYSSHRWALMGLRWLNGHPISYTAQQEEPGKKSKGRRAAVSKKRRLIVEFAIENAQVVLRRKEQEAKGREGPDGAKGHQASTRKREGTKDDGKRRGGGLKRKRQGEHDEDHGHGGASGGLKRKRERENDQGHSKGGVSAVPFPAADDQPEASRTEKEAHVRRQRIIAKKRMQRNQKRKGM
ncbi:MAG: RNA recognition motif-containing protein [Phylliscum demangeonii]|nr:MAG: RNA recognition motif-containing protein [Phylliscum demangeonii]